MDPRLRLRLLPAVAVLLGALLAIALGAALAVADAAEPQVEVREVECYSDERPCPQGLSARQVTVQTSCGPVDLLRRPHETLVEASVVEADGDPATREIRYEGRSGASARVGEVGVVRMDRGADGCERPRYLFRHPGKRFSTQRPKRASYSATGWMNLVDAQHLRLEQPWYRRTDGGCCPAYTAIATFAYDARSQRYVRTAQRVKRNRRG